MKRKREFEKLYADRKKDREWAIRLPSPCLFSVIVRSFPVFVRVNFVLVVATEYCESMFLGGFLKTRHELLFEHLLHIVKIHFFPGLKPH